MTAYDETSADGESAITTVNQAQAARGTDVSEDKDTTSSQDKQAKDVKIGSRLKSRCKCPNTSVTF